MSLAANVKLRCRMDDILLIDERSGAGLSVSGDPVSLVPGKFGSAVSLTPATYLSAGGNLGLTSSFSIGFWMKSRYAGVAETPSQQIVPMKMSLLSIAGFAYNAMTGETTATTPSLVVWEESRPSGVNAVSASVYGTTSATSSSVAYVPGDWHHVWITYDGTSPSLKVYLDAVTSSGTTGTVPSSLTNSPSPFQINRGVPGLSYNTARNTCQIDDLVVLGTAVNDTSTILRVMNLGSGSVADTASLGVREMYVGDMFDDPSTVQTDAVAQFGADLYVSRSDGRLERGHRRLWGSRNAFGTTSEQSRVVDATGGKCSFDRGVMHTTTTMRV